MSHALAYVVLPPDTTRANAKERVAVILAPFDEEITDDGWWDWWQVGGRWTGTFSDYDPAKDPANVKTCLLCGGTGQRTDPIAAGIKGCNGCESTGRAVEWPTAWVAHDGDVAPLAVLETAREPFTLVTPAGVLHRETWDGEHFVTDEDFTEHYRKAVSQYPGHMVAVVDYHS